MNQCQQDVATFLGDWVETEEQNKVGFERLYKLLQDKEKGSIEFHPRPGVTYSLRGMSLGEDAPSLYVMVDVIEDKPRWLSVCFYGDMITDPEERGAFVPGGLLGEDAICFDLERYDQQGFAYVEARIEEAYVSAVTS
jgi:hypothetical protein